MKAALYAIAALALAGSAAHADTTASDSAYPSYQAAAPQKAPVALKYSIETRDQPSIMEMKDQDWSGNENNS